MGKTLSDFFIGVGIKRLSSVEVSRDSSNQHELNGIGKFKKIFGIDAKTFNAKYIFIPDEEEKVIESIGSLTWYDSRRNVAKRSSEYRLYYTENEVMSSAKAGDLVIVAQTDKNTVAIIVAPGNSTSEKQLLWLFNEAEITDKFVVKNLSDANNDIGFPGRYIISSLGFEIEETAPDYLNEIQKKFGSRFPSTKNFSEFARSTVKNVSPIEEPDRTLMAWLEREELLFKTLEKEIIKEVLKNGFGNEKNAVEEFLRISLSVQNRRKSRAGHSFENNLVALFNLNNIRYSRGATTERNNKPDFIFPGSSYYHNENFDVSFLTMLGVKTTAKDRWRQILSEASKINIKHLITLEPSITWNQTEDMKANNVQLVIPEPLMVTYQPDQQRNIINLKEFISLVKAREGIL